MNISEPFIRRPVATTLLMAALAFVGVVAYPFLPVARLPQVDFPTIQVTATFQGASAETMAASVASPAGGRRSRMSCRWGQRWPETSVPTSPMSTRSRLKPGLC